jgi:hypothetical protein
LNVPKALISKSSRGSVTEVVTATWPASEEQVGRNAPTMFDCRQFSISALEPDRVRSATSADCPQATARKIIQDGHRHSCPAKCCGTTPIKPAPPVIRFSRLHSSYSLQKGHIELTPNIAPTPASRCILVIA